MDISARGRTPAARRRTTPQETEAQSRQGHQRQWSGNGHPAAPELDLKKLLRALQAVRDGDFTVRLATDQTGLGRQDRRHLQRNGERQPAHVRRSSNAPARWSARKARRASASRASGAPVPGATMESSVNTLIDDLLWPTAEVTRTITAVAKGDLTQSMRLEADGRPLKGEFLRSANVVNEMITQMGVFTSEVTRVAREVGTEGKLGGQAAVLGASGVWKDLTDNVNSMAANLTGQVRNISEVTIAVANGDLSRKITVDVRGEILQLKEAINTMVDQLRSFASEVTRVAREVGTEGKLGGQAIVPGVAGTWKDLTDNVNSHGRQPDRPGAQHRRGDHGRGERRPVAQDHGGRARRNPAAEGNHQHDGGPAAIVRLGSDARGARGRHRRQARRPGRGARRRRHLEGSHRQRELDGREPDRPGAQHRRSDHRRGERRLVAQDHGGRARRNPAAEGNHQHDGGPAAIVRLGSDARGARGRHRRQTRRPGHRARRRGHVEGSHRQRELHGRRTSPARCATSPR